MSALLLQTLASTHIFYGLGKGMFNKKKHRDKIFCVTINFTFTTIFIAHLWFPIDVDVGQSMRSDSNFEAQCFTQVRRGVQQGWVEWSWLLELSAAQEYISATATAAQWGGGTTLSLWINLVPRRSHPTTERLGRGCSKWALFAREKVGWTFRNEREGERGKRGREREREGKRGREFVVIMIFLVLILVMLLILLLFGLLKADMN